MQTNGIPTWDETAPIDEGSDVPTWETSSASNYVRARSMAYGPVVGEYHPAAMFGPAHNRLGRYDVAVSPDLESQFPLGSYIEDSNGKILRVADRSFISQGQPTSGVIERRDVGDLGHEFYRALTPDEIQARIDAVSKRALMAGGLTGAAVQSAGGQNPTWEETAPVPTFEGTTAENPVSPAQPSFIERIKAFAQKPSPEWLRAPEEATRELIGGMLPHDVPSYLESIYPPVAMAKQGAGLVQGFLRGDVSAVPFVGRVPEIIEAEKTPAFSKERYLAAEKTLMDLGLLGGVGELGEAASAKTTPMEMSGARGFTFRQSEAPVPLPSEPVAPSWQPIKPGTPPPYGPEYQAWEQQRYGGPRTPDLGMWPLSTAAQPPVPGSVWQLAEAIRQLPSEPTLPEKIAQTQTAAPIGIKSIFSTAGSTDILYQKAFDALQKGQDTISGVKDPMLARHRAAFERGEIKSWQDLKAQEEGEPPPEPTPPITPAPSPLLRPGEKSTGELFQGTDQPFNLAGETGIDTEALQRAKEAEAAAKAKALADQEAAQMQLLGADLSPEEQAAMHQQYQQELLAEAEEHMARGGGELLDAVKSGGGMSLTDPELAMLREQFLEKSKHGQQKFAKPVSGEDINYGDVFKADAGPLDQLTQHLKQSGFDVETPDDTRALVDERLRTGKPIYGSEARAQALEEASFGRAGIERYGEAAGVPQPGPSRVLAPGAVRGSGRYREVYRVNKEAGDKMNALAASPESADLRAAIQSRKVLGDLTPPEANDLGRYMVSENMKVVNPDHPQILSPLEGARISRNPRIARAINRYKREVEPEVETLHKQAGLKAINVARKQSGSGYVRLVPATDEPLPEIQTPVGGVPLRFRSKTTTSAQAAEGLAARYETDLRTILGDTYGEVLRKARLRDLYEHLAKRGLARPESVDEIQGQPAVPVAIGRAAGGELSTALPEVTFMPTQIANALRDVMEQPPEITSPFLKTLKAAQRGVTGTALTANPAELMNHMRRQLDAVSAIPSAHAPVPVRAVEALLPYFGPRLGTVIRTVTDNMSTAENRGILQDIFDAGGGSTRAFKEYQAKHIPGVRTLQNYTQKLLFGIPEGRGVGGWDLRMRVQLEKVRRAVEGNTDPQRIREFANQIGQYTSKPDKLIDIMRTINPYSATSLPLRGTEFKQLLGGSGLKANTLAGAAGLRAETLLRGAGGTLMALVTANHLLSGHWPWQNDPGHEMDLDTGMQDAKGKEVYLKLRAVAPTLSRPLQTLSVPELGREYRTAAPDKKSMIGAGMVGPANAVMSALTSPLANTAIAAATGFAPYLTKKPGEKAQLYDVVPYLPAGTPKGSLAEAILSGKPTGDRGLDNLVAAIRGINPLGRATAERGTPLPSPLKYIERPLPGVEPFGSIFTTAYEAKPQKPQTVAQKIRAQKAAATRQRHKQQGLP